MSSPPLLRKVAPAGVAALLVALAAGADSGVTLDLEPETVSGEGLPGQWVTYEFVLSSKAEVEQDFTLNFTGWFIGWSFKLPPEHVKLLPGEKRTIAVDVRSPNPADGSRSFTLRALNTNVSGDSDAVTLVYQVTNETSQPTPSNSSGPPTTSASPLGPDPTTAPSEPAPSNESLENEIGGESDGPGTASPPGPGIDGASNDGASPENLARPVPTTSVGWISAGLTSAGLLALLLHESVRFRLMFLLTLFSRLDRSSLLDHSVRERIVTYVQRTPGVHYTGLKQGLGLKNGVLLHHLLILQRERLIRSRPDGLRKRFYPHDGPPPAGSIPTAREASILRLVEAKPGLLQREIARQLGMSKQITNYHLRKLERAGRLFLERDGRRSQCYPRRPTVSPRHG